MSVAVDSFQDMAQRIEPDVQATLSDFLTYTEHFPAHLTRALTLIQAETLRAERAIASIHANTTIYSQLPSLPASQHKDLVELRRDISYALEEAERAGRMRLEEATRLAEMATREQARLGILVGKLRAIPLPSRDPTPEDDGALTSPNLSRTARFGMEITAEKTLRRPYDKAVTKLRARKIVVPGEVLPPPDPNAPPETYSDWSSPESTPPVEEPPAQRKNMTPRPRSRTPKLPKYDRSDAEERERKLARARGPRMPGQPGTNAHSAVAGISTSNALLALNPPPTDAAPGSRWLPWMKLTEWEMAKLRKRMKKNAIWVPSATMLRRELKNLGRGVAGREAARSAAEAQGKSLVDESAEADPTKIEAMFGYAADPSAIMLPVLVAEEDDDADAELVNRGMRLNEAKKLKRARLLEEQREASAQIAREQANEALEAVSIKTERKRKRESTPIKQHKDSSAQSPDQLAKAGPPTRRIKLAHNPAPTQAQVDGKSAESTITSKAASRNSDRRKTATPPSTAAPRRPTLVLKASKAVSEEPRSRRASLRRNSNASLPNSGTTSPGKAPARRSKRPAPGVITGGDGESATVSASRRKAAPRIRSSGAHSKPAAAAAAATATAPELHAEDELIDPDEPRYCVCGDVSWGTMIQCENDVNCEKEWFHLSCVGLSELPPRRTKWYCPDCRKKLKLGQSTNGLVGPTRGTTSGR